MIPDWAKLPPKMGWDTWPQYFHFSIRDWMERFRDHFTQWFQCRQNKHQVKFGSHGYCIYCHKHIGYGKGSSLQNW